MRVGIAVSIQFFEIDVGDRRPINRQVLGYLARKLICQTRGARKRYRDLRLFFARAEVPGAGSMKNFTPSRVDLVLSSTLRASFWTFAASRIPLGHSVAGPGSWPPGAGCLGSGMRIFDEVFSTARLPEFRPLRVHRRGRKITAADAAPTFGFFPAPRCWRSNGNSPVALQRCCRFGAAAGRATAPHRHLHPTAEAGRRMRDSEFSTTYLRFSALALFPTTQGEALNVFNWSRYIAGHRSARRLRITSFRFCAGGQLRSAIMKR